MTAYQCRVSVGLILAGLLPMGLAGCGSHSMPTYRVGGKVVFADGKPLGGGSVWLEPVQGAYPCRERRGQIQPDGSFQLSTYGPNGDAVEGEYRALVSPPLPKSGLKELKVVPMVIDPRFTQFGTSGLKVTVTPDPAKNQFVLQVDRPRPKRE